ncbi:mechanosensitive ion channel family protein [Flammeovirga pectinis]|uniref:Mechanosensitive ion channel family protein n=1 Tax=Flammeovirga pectinis TaxID=2494373 RepID=A0A3Q9FMU9_9BACT|nr:mechanosensitive ion channel family protein [Flammeovirga pectinis]AZQ63407.1 mechanosensitive ion channel family protein [Flammeovirga pectinis]
MSKLLYTLFAFCALMVSSSVFAQQANDEEVILESYPNDHDFYKFYIYDSVEYSQSTPYHALHTHLDFLEEGSNYHPKVSARVIPTSVGNLEERIDLADELKLIYAGKGIYLHSLDLPLQKDYVEKNTGKSRFIISDKLPDIYLIKVSGRWRYSSYSSLKIHKIFKETFPSYSRDIIKYVSKIERGNQIFLNIKLWQWAALITIFIAFYFIYYIVTWFLSFIIKALFTKGNNEYFISKVISSYKKPVTIAILVFFFYMMLPLLLLESHISYGLALTCRFVFGLAAAFFIFRTADLFVFKVMSSGSSFSIDEHLTPILRSSFRLIALILGFLVILKLMGYNINNLITGISFGGLIIAFAAQDTVKNFIGSIMLFTDKPFKVGDSIIVSGQAGIVEEIGFRTTKVRSFNNSLISLPNNIAADNIVDNMGKRDFRRFKTMITIEYGTDRKLIRTFIEKIKAAIEKHPQTRKEGYQVRLFQFSSSSLDILLNVFFRTDDYDVELATREELMFDIMEIAEELNVQFAFPTQTIHMASGNNLESDDSKS